jgi:HKD family nuclease
MQITFLGQGYEATSRLSVGNYLIKFLADKNFKSFTGITAFTSLGGVNGLSNHLILAKEHLKKNITIITGVDLRGTSKEALEALLKLKIKAYVFYHPASPIFHPKIYLFESETRSELIIGSSNLTSQGLFTNVESSIHISIDNTLAADREIIEHLKEYFKSIFEHNDPNLQKLSIKVINDLVKAKLVPTEAERKRTQEKQDGIDNKKTNDIISKLFPKRELAKMPKEFRGTKTKKGDSKADSESIVVSPIGKNKGELVWSLKKLPASSVQYSKDGTNPTGGLRLVQGRFEINGKRISQTTYFRNTLFGEYDWKEIRNSPFVEAAKVPFDITISGKHLGKHYLEVKHKPSGEAGQGNYTTSISWGELGDLIRDSNLVGSKLELYAPKGKSRTYKIIIS